MSSSDEGGAGFAVVIVLFFVIGGINDCSQGVKDRSYQRELAKQEKQRLIKIESGKKDVYSFVKKMNRQLHDKIKKVIEEEADSEDRIDELVKLKNRHPSKSDIINSSISDWNNLNQKLDSSIDEIYKQVEETFIIYKINELQGGNAFKKKESDLTRIANQAIEEAKITSSIVRSEAN